VTLAALEPLSGWLVIYLNRLSDLLFVLARAVNCSQGRPDDPWRQDSV
jgi:cob(I)alamin adenosyltransferase